jgi:gamma-glutamyl hydrolase
MPVDLINAVQQKDLTIQIHTDGILPQTYEEIPELNEAFHVIGVAHDRQGLEHVACVEHKKYPFYGVQFHPEKASTIWVGSTNAPHSSDARALSQYYANFIVDESRRNGNSMEWKELKKRMFVNADYTMTNNNYQDVYVFY